MNFDLRKIMNFNLKYLVLPVITFLHFGNINAIEIESNDYNEEEMGEQMKSYAYQCRDHKVSRNHGIRNLLYNENLTEEEKDYIVLLAKTANLFSKALVYVKSINYDISEFLNEDCKHLIGELVFILSQYSRNNKYNIEFNKDLFLNKIKKCFNENKITKEQYKSLLEWIISFSTIYDRWGSSLKINKKFSRNIIKDYVSLLCKHFDIGQDFVHQVIQSIKQWMIFLTYTEDNSAIKLYDDEQQIKDTNIRGGDTNVFLKFYVHKGQNGNMVFSDNDNTIDEKFHISGLYQIIVAKSRDKLIEKSEKLSKISSKYVRNNLLYFLPEQKITQIAG